MTQAHSVLFLCTGNSARSILAEALLNHHGGGRFKAWSAGSQPKGQPHPMALQVLEHAGIATEGLASKSWHDVARPDAPRIDFIITVCDNAAGETCPVWPGKPVAAHWGIEDPAAVEGAGQQAAFEQAMHYLHNRIALLLALPDEAIDALALGRIGAQPGATPKAATGA